MELEKEMQLRQLEALHGEHELEMERLRQTTKKTKDKEIESRFGRDLTEKQKATLW